MPANDSNKPTLQAPGYYALVYLSDMSGDEVLNATVSSTPTYPALNLAITVNTGSAASVARGMRVVIESASGRYKGVLVVRNAGTISSTNLPVREFSAGWANVVSGDVLRVYSDFPPADKLVADDDTFAPGEEVYIDQNEDPAPIPTSGGYDARWLADASAIPFTGSTSYGIGSDAGSSLAHQWTTSGGALSSPTTADVTLNAGAAGKFLITHTVTSAVNGKSRTQYTRSRVHDDNDPPYEVILVQPPSCDEETGWKCRIRLIANADLTTLRDYAHVLLWVPGQSFGSATPGRSHILMDGYLRRDEQNINPVLNTIEFDVISPLAALAELPGFSKVMLYEASPDAWSEFTPLSVGYAAIKLITDYTTLIESGRDVVFNGFSDALYSALFLVKDNPLAQVRELAMGRAARFVCLKNGRFEFQGMLEVVALANRAAITMTYTIGMDDVDAGGDGTDGITLTREHQRPLETYRLRGFTAGQPVAENTPLFAKWGSPGMGNQSTTQEKVIFDNAAQLYAWCGMLAAAADRVYQNDDDSLDHAPSARVPTRGMYWAIFDFHREYIAFDDYDAASNLRGVDLTAFRWQFRGLALDWDETGLPRATLELDAETAGAAGVDDTPDQSGIDPGTDPGDTVPPITPTVTVNGLSPKNPNLALVSYDGYVYLLNILTLACSRYDLAALGMQGDGPLSFVVDPYSPLYLNTGTAVNGMIVTTTHAYMLNDIAGTPTLTNEYAFRYEVSFAGRYVQSTRAQQGFFAVNTHNRAADGGKNDVDVTLDGGATWFRYTDLGNAYPGGGGDENYAGIHVSEHTPNRLWVCAFDSTAAGEFYTQVYRSDNAGVSWTPFGPNNYRSTGNMLHLPYMETGESMIYVGSTAIQNPSYFDHMTVKLTASTATPIYPDPTGIGYMGNSNQFGLKTYDLNPNIGIFFGLNRETLDAGVWRTTDAFSTFIEVMAVAPVASLPYMGNIAGDNPNVFYAWGTAMFLMSFDGGASWTDYSSALTGVGAGGSSIIVNICGVGG